MEIKYSIPLTVVEDDKERLTRIVFFSEEDKTMYVVGETKFTVDEISNHRASLTKIARKRTRLALEEKRIAFAKMNSYKLYRNDIWSKAIRTAPTNLVA